MVTNSNPSKGKMSPKSTTWGRRKGNVWGMKAKDAQRQGSLTCYVDRKRMGMRWQVRSWRQSYAQGLTLERSRTSCRLEGIQLTFKLQFVEEPVEIMETGESITIERSRIPTG
ncbi:hypothetical protein Tco_0152434 [Tanacetum coccineum]